MAGTSRVANYARGLLERNVEVEVYCLRPSEAPGTAPANLNVSGEWEGVRFRYLCGTTQSSFSRMQRYMTALKGIMAARSLAGVSNFECPDAILLYKHDTVLYSLLAYYLSKCHNAVLVGETTEEIYIDLKNQVLKKVAQMSFVKGTARCYDGMVVISEWLRRRLAREIGDQFPITKIPIIVDTERFATETMPFAGALRTVGYCGNFRRLEEGMAVLNVFERATRGLPNCRLKLMGVGPPQNMEALKTRAQEVKPGGEVCFVGLVPPEELPKALGTCDVLILPRADGVFSRAGMPNKLGEYLATGRPTVVSSTGEIGCYLRDGHDAYLVPPGHEDVFADRLRYALTHPAEASVIGRMGCETCKRWFDVKPNIMKLLEFINAIRKTKPGKFVEG